MGIHQRIRFHRKRVGATQESVAKSLGIGTANYAKYESGERNPKDNRLLEIAKILNVSYASLKTGDERIAVDLLNAHLRGAVLGDIGGFTAFHSDFNLMDVVSETIMSFFSAMDEMLQRKYSNFHSEFVKDPTIASLVELDKRFKATYMDDADHSTCIEESPAILDPQCEFDHEELDDATIYKLAFCIAAVRYMDLSDTGDFNIDVFLSDVSDYLGNNMTKNVDTLQLFAVLVFAPFLSHIIRAIEFIDDNNSNMDDFPIAFMHYSLTPTGDDDEWTDHD